MTETRTRTRMKVLAWLAAFMFAALATRLWFLQVLAQPQFEQMAQQNQVRVVPITPVRGEVLDRNGKVLVGRRSSVVVTIDPQALPVKETDAVLFRLSNLLHVPVGVLVTRLKSVQYLPYQPVPVAEDVTQQDVFYIREHQDLFPGVGYQLEHAGRSGRGVGHVPTLTQADADAQAVR